MAFQSTLLDAGELGLHLVVLRSYPDSVLRSHPWRFLGDHMRYRGSTVMHCKQGKQLTSYTVSLTLLGRLRKNFGEQSFSLHLL